MLVLKWNRFAVHVPPFQSKLQELDGWCHAKRKVAPKQLAVLLQPMQRGCREQSHSSATTTAVPLQAGVGPQVTLPN